MAFAGFVDEAGTELVLFSETRGAGLVFAELVAEAMRSVRGGGFF
jgi:hypothetical protein